MLARRSITSELDKLLVIELLVWFNVLGSSFVAPVTYLKGSAGVSFREGTIQRNLMEEGCRGLKL